MTATAAVVERGHPGQTLDQAIPRQSVPVRVAGVHGMMLFGPVVSDKDHVA